MSLVEQINALATAVGHKLRDSVFPRLLPAGGTSGQVLAKTGVGDFQAVWSVPPGGIVPLWAGKLYGAMGRCDPSDLFNYAVLSGTVAATPTNITTSIARVCYFRPPANITVQKIRFYGVGATTNVYRVAIYNATTAARVTGELPITTAAGQWGSVSTGGVILTAGQLYFIAVSVNATGTVAGILCAGPSQAATSGTIAAAPFAYPGSMDLELGFMDSALSQFAVTSGTLPAIAPAIGAQSAWTGGFPALCLDSSGA